MSKKGAKGASGMATFKVGKDHGRVKVFVRVRPLNSDEVGKKEANAVNVVVEDAKIEISDSKYGSDKTYLFDHVFPQSYTNAEVSRTISKPIIKSALNGFNGTLMAYGQTGAGKTYTLMGPDGITDTVINTCFARISEDETHAFKVTMSYLQIYQEKIYDLLNSNNKVELMLREHPQTGIYVENLTEFVVRNPSEVMNMLSFGRKRLVFAETKMNRHSSRSHSVCVLGIERSSIQEAKKDKDKTGLPCNSLLPYKEKSKDASSKKSSPQSKSSQSSKELHPAHSQDRDANNSTIPLGEMQDDDESGISEVAAFGEDVKLRGKIYICDLAGSERLKKTHAEGDRLSEAQHINMSLLELGNVIQALAEDRKSHVPFRNSTLTRLLQESLGGNCKTSLIVCVSPASCHVSETKSTLNFGLRAMKVTNNAYVNLEVDYKKLSDELAKMLNRRDRDMELIKEENQKEIDLVKQEYGEKMKELAEERNKALDQVREYTEKKERKLQDEIGQLKMALLAEKEERKRLEREFIYLREDVEKQIKSQLQAQLNSIFDYEEPQPKHKAEPELEYHQELPPEPIKEITVEPEQVFNQVPDLVKSVFVSEILSRQLFIAVGKFSSRLTSAVKNSLTVEKWLNRISDMKKCIQDGAFMLLYNLGHHLNIPVEYWIDDVEEIPIDQNETTSGEPCNITDDEKVKLFSKTKGLSEEAKRREFHDMSQEELSFALRRTKYSIDREAVSLLRCMMGDHELKDIYDKEEELDGLLDKLLHSMDAAEYRYLDGSLKEFHDPKHFHQSLCYLLIDKSLQSCIVLLEQALKDTRRQDVQVVYSPFALEKTNRTLQSQERVESMSSPLMITSPRDLHKDNLSDETEVQIIGASVEKEGMGPSVDDDTVSIRSSASYDKDMLSERCLSPDSGILSPDTRSVKLDSSWERRMYRDVEKTHQFDYSVNLHQTSTSKDVEKVLSNVNELDKQYVVIRKDQDKLGELLSQLKERLVSVGEMCAKTPDKEGKKSVKTNATVPSLKRTPTISERIMQGRQQEKDLKQVHTETKKMEEHVNEIENYQSNISSKLAETNDTVEKLKLEKMMKKDEAMELRREILALKRERFQLEMEQDKLDDENEMLKEIEQIVHELLDVEEDIKGLKCSISDKSQLGLIEVTNSDSTLIEIGKQGELFTAGFCGF